MCARIWCLLYFYDVIFGSMVKENCTYVRNPGYPTSVTDVTTCDFEVQKVDKNVCSLRLDFEAFSIVGLADTIEATGDMCIDTFIGSAATTGDTTPSICGDNAGEHIYLDIGEGEMNTGKMAFAFDTTTSQVGRTFEIKVTQIFCNSPTRPPSGCLQYHLGTDGRFTTFNFAAEGGHLPNQRYNICLRREQGFCCVHYQVCSDTNSFSLDIFMDTVADPTLAQSLEEELCLTDYIIIEGSSSDCHLTQNTQRYCGQKLADSQVGKADLAICDCTPPFQVSVITDAKEDTLTAAAQTVLSRGLCLTYHQTPCGANF